LFILNIEINWAVLKIFTYSRHSHI